MAITKTITKQVPGFEGTLTCQNAYWRVQVISGDKANILATVRGYARDDTGELGEIIDTQTIPVTININSSDNIFTQVYNYLKQLPEFEGGIDC